MLMFPAVFGTLLELSVGALLAGVYLAIRLWTRPDITSPERPTPRTIE